MFCFFYLQLSVVPWSWTCPTNPKLKEQRVKGFNHLWPLMKPLKPHSVFIYTWLALRASYKLICPGFLTFRSGWEHERQFVSVLPGSPLCEASASLETLAFLFVLLVMRISSGDAQDFSFLKCQSYFNLRTTVFVALWRSLWGHHRRKKKQEIGHEEYQVPSLYSSL